MVFLRRWSCGYMIINYLTKITKKQEHSEHKKASTYVGAFMELLICLYVEPSRSNCVSGLLKRRLRNRKYFPRRY